jgi:hypothetical protein
MLVLRNWWIAQLKLFVILCVVSGWAASGVDARVLTGPFIGTTEHVVGSDGARFAAWRTVGAASTTVYDLAQKRARVVPDPAGCADPVIGSAALLYTCAANDPAMLAGAGLVDLRSGVFREVVAPQANQGLEARVWIGIGARWMQALDSSSIYHSQSSVFFERATGVWYGGSRPFGAHRQPDLNRQVLVRRICSPLRASPDGFQNLGGASSDGYVPLLFKGEWALNTGPELTTGPSSPPLVLQRCGSHRRRVICRDACVTPAFVGGQVVWGDRVDLLTHRLSDHRRRRYSPKTGAVAGSWTLGNRVLVAIDDPGANTAQGLLKVQLANLGR